MTAPTVVHCSDPLDPRGVDAAFAEEAAVARDAGFTSVRVDHDALVAGDMRGALRRLGPPSPGPAVYRGWMMRAEAYGRLHAALASRGLDLMTSPGEYAACHHYPGTHAALGDVMPETAFVPAASVGNRDAVMGALSGFGGAPVTLRDWAKSQASGYWKEACLIPHPGDADAAMRVVARFLDLQGDDLVGGLVFRRLLDLETSGDDVREWRAFVVGGTVVGCWPRHRDGSGEPPPTGFLSAVAPAVPSPFASVDVVRDRAGRPWVMEAGDGQVSGFPPGATLPVLAALRASLANGRPPR